MLSQHPSERYKRQLQLPGFGAEAQKKLSAAKVLVIGAGGLGVPALQYLAGMGIGNIGIVDDDVITLSNLHRQVLFTTSETGQSKVSTAAAKLTAQNPEIDITAFNTRLKPDNALGLVGAYDIVLDATDNISTRYLINDACVILNKSFVYGAVHQYEGHLSVFNYKDGPTYRCLYPTPPSTAEIPDCNTAGVLGAVPGIVGCNQALEVVKLLTGIGKNLSGYLQVHDFLNGDQYKVKLKVNPSNKKILNLQDSYEIFPCDVHSNLISSAQLQEWYSANSSFVLIDVREEHEFGEGHLSTAQNLPLASLSDGVHSIPSDLPVILYCQKGGRSAKAAKLLREQQPGMQVLELEGGYDNWLQSRSHS